MHAKPLSICFIIRNEYYCNVFVFHTMALRI